MEVERTIWTLPGRLWRTARSLVIRAVYEGGAVYCYSSPVITNTILAFNSSGVYAYGGAPRIAVSVVSTATSPTTTLVLPIRPEPKGTFLVDPAFIRSPSVGPDGVWATTDDDYGDLRLQAGSPCIDAGDNSAVPKGHCDRHWRPGSVFRRPGHSRYRRRHPTYRRHRSL